MASDRIFGLITLVLALFYMVSSYHIQTSFLADPVGPKAFPMMIGAVAAICSAIIVAKPDPDPAWPAGRVFGALAVAVAALIAYSYMLKPLGFVIPTAIVAAILSYQINPQRIKAMATGIGLAVVLYAIFKYILGLSLVGFGKPLMAAIGLGS
jgi:putative tricarboxylic transport membrane protein